MQTELTEYNCHIFFTESEIGVHRKMPQDKTEIVHILAGTFLPSFNLLKKEWFFDGSIVISAMKIYEQALQKGYRVNFLIGYDLDENGEFMALTLKRSLVGRGISPDSIYRTPLCEKGYIGIMPFCDISSYERYRTRDLRFQESLMNKKIDRIGLLKAMSLYFLSKNRGKEILIKNEGISTSTVVYQGLCNKGRSFGF